MAALHLELPRAVAAGDEQLAALLAWLPVDGAIAVCIADADAIGIACGDAAALTVPLLPAPGSGVEISPGRHVQAPDFERVDRLLRLHGTVLDHIGVNFSQRDIGEATWLDFVERLAVRLPVYRLDIGSANDIVFVVIERGDAQPAAVLELVLDRGAQHTNLHFCLRVGASRADLERTFAAPYGGCKPGDEDFFRSVGLPSLLRLPAYLDLAFAEAAVAPWPQTVRAIGHRVGG